MKNRTKGVVAGVAGVALLAGGTTFALWSDSADVAGGTITNGKLDVEASALAWVDASPDRADKGHAISNLTTWRMVPGDVVEGTSEIDVTLVGDNLVAELGVDTTAAANLPTGMTVTYAVYDGATTTDPVATGALGKDSSLRFAANREGQAAGNPTNPAPTIVVGTDGTAELKVVVTATFSGTVTGTTSAGAATDLSKIGVTLTQVREGTDFTAPTTAP
ncbi:alternate-type signal peptide domain-containing protein [Cellulomonas sp. zg-ZUI199]|uniref:Alternate-type signal peptide domain-containing protein n=1 Tax=Cellulomonas wangleii TaxID=2816956 RepID=A0ABX8D1U3_9CELL|nr:alternate-type signal peptide domain-containing protein [Cellulomonas wangleii]MBO0923061.1 alternate-type signal peptide domain-containing protein [Cellulomonas wangleii]QVI61445.1 alternate-type signal peptide domain-containing protein [Cellulomonas wangleii]